MLDTICEASDGDQVLDKLGCPVSALEMESQSDSPLGGLGTLSTSDAKGSETGWKGTGALWASLVGYVCWPVAAERPTVSEARKARLVRALADRSRARGRRPERCRATVSR